MKVTYKLEERKSEKTKNTYYCIVFYLDETEIDIVFLSKPIQALLTHVK
jgi:hypothetical protein